MDRLRDIFLYAIAALAMFALLCAIYQAMHERNGSAITLGTLFLVAALIVFIPQLEVLKVWGVETRLRQSLDRAEEIIGRLRRLSTISARGTYLTMAWSNRMGAPSAKDKQAVLDDVESQLADLNVTDAERRAITRPYVQMIGWDFYLIFTNTMDRYLNWKQDEQVRRLNANQTEENTRAVQEFPAKQSEWRSIAHGDGAFARLSSFKLADELQRVMPIPLLDERELRAAETLRADLVRLFQDCERKGGYTAEAADFYDKYHDLGGYGVKIKELFGVNPSELR